MEANGTCEELFPHNKKRGWKQYLEKYFFEGQATQHGLEDDRILETAWDRTGKKYRKYIAFLIPFCFYQPLWMMAAIRHNFFAIYKHTWPVALVSLLGCTVAGMTSEGSGAVFFPVMTILMNVDTTTSRDFSIMCQSFGMTTALFVILYSGIRIETKAIFAATLGAVPGMIIGFELIDPMMTGPAKKAFFVSVWASFAIALYMLNAEKKRKTYTLIPEFCLWKGAVLAAAGFAGGIFTALTGSGVDVATFSILTTLFRVTEKTATPTTVVLMAVNTVIGFFYRGVIQFNISKEAYEYMFMVIPICTAFCPLGSAIGSHFHRQVLASLIYILEVVSLIGFLISGPSIHLLINGGAVIVFGFLFFYTLCRLGYMLMERVERKLREKRAARDENSDSNEMSNDCPLIY